RGSGPAGGGRRGRGLRPAVVAGPVLGPRIGRDGGPGRRASPPRRSPGLSCLRPMGRRVLHGLSADAGRVLRPRAPLAAIAALATAAVVGWRLVDGCVWAPRRDEAPGGHPAFGRSLPARRGGSMVGAFAERQERRRGAKRSPSPRRGEGRGEGDCGV